MKKAKIKVSYSGRETEIDSEFNFLYVTIHPTVNQGILMASAEMDKSITSNIGIYNLKDGTTSYLFDQNENKRILSFYFEKNYNEAHHRIDFNNSTSHIINNEKIDKRATMDRLFVVTEGNSKEELELWRFTKAGDSKQLVKTFSEKDAWKLDVVNQKILFIRKSPHKVQVDSFDW